jgi:alkanesulfonate monooxygenase SsuD/methylene tetrahydromethanopterin reductase-like flavin-dependent oxidoreductase (luciferase family)
VRFSIWPSTQQPWSDILEVTRYAESTGWDGVYVADHFMGSGDAGGGPTTPTLEATAVMAALAEATERVRIGSLVFSVTFRHPAVLAKWAASVDHVSDGRLLLGIGAGWQPNEHDQYGIELGSLRTRIERFEEACEVLVGLLRHDVTNVGGQHYVVSDAIAEPKPVQRPLPLLIGCKGDRMIGIAARYADVWNAWGLADTIADRMALLDDRCAAIGRDPASIERSCQALWFITDDIDRAEEMVSRSPMAAIAGPPERLADAVAAWREAGVDEVIVPDFTLGQGRERLDRMDVILNEVAAAFL